MDGVVEQFRNTVDVVRGDPEPPRSAQDVAVPLTRLADHGCIDDRHEFCEVLNQYSVEQRLVAVLERDQTNELFQVVGLGAEVLKFECDLLGHGALHRRQQSLQAKLTAFLKGEGRVLVSHGIPKQFDSG